jgi:[ribosomal protein S18]-alanine N-acetyltransferase
MKVELIISVLTAFHAGILAELHKETFKECWSEQDFKDLLAMPTAFGFLAHREKQPVGFVICQGLVDEAEIITIGTRPDERRTGVAKALLDRALQQVQVMFLEVADDNMSAQAFYTKCGFKEVGRRRKYYKRENAQAVDALVLKLSL